MWLPGTQLNDGISYDYAEKHKFIKSKHNFENDIIVSAKKHCQEIYEREKPYPVCAEKRPGNF